ncbi:hypothetical protein BpHYR1_053114 [Brachionus plicatilis]|uniref:RNA-directed DNA polymerase from mobile element jockey-like n=1 Tax=Brachionus plicatilis TaxID=10195 RepID=A0A3M7RCX7_BRAPC|nr:hypothetical protein BpHYR1_053114 [Brachionus plicatilis]
MLTYAKFKKIYAAAIRGFQQYIIFVLIVDNSCFSLLNIIKILSNSKWGLSSILDYYFPILNTLSENLVRKLQVIQNSAIRSILKLKFDIPSEIDELTERYVRNALENSVNMVVQLVKEYNLGFESRYINFPTPLCNCRGITEDFLQV